MPEKPTYQELQQRIAALEAEIQTYRTECARPPDRTDLEESLRISEERFRTAFHTSPDSILISDMNGTVIDINEGSTRLTGYSREESIGKTLLELNLYENPSDRQRILKQGLATGSIRNVETRFVKKNGEIFTGLVTAQKIKLGTKDAFLSITRDISDIKAAQEALRKSESRFKELAEMLPDAVFETDRKRRLTYGNKRFFALFGYASDDLGSLQVENLIVAAERNRARTNVSRRKSGENVGPIEYEGIRSDGTRFPALINANPIHTEKGAFAGLRGTVIDLTQQKLAEAERAKIEAQYMQSQKMEAIGRLAGGISHDLNNMLTPIIGYADLLLPQFDSGDKRREKVHRIADAGRKARNLVHQLLAYSRKQTLEYKALNLNLIIKSFANLLRRTIRENIRIKLKLAPKLGTIEGDIGQIEQVVMNLCVNAQDAMPQGGILTLETAVVRIDAACVERHADIQPGVYTMMAVSDNGIGMDDNIQGQIFEPFFSTKGDQGTGLGLATVDGIVKQHGGSIWVYSEPDMGTVIKVFLPQAATTEPAFKVAENSRITSLEGVEGILLVEDNQDVRELVTHILKPLGYSMHVAANATEALALAAANPDGIDLVITDVIMPDMNGKEMFDRMAEFLPHACVLYMSGYTDEVIAHQGVLKEGTHFLQKPFTVYGLSQKIRQVLAKK